MEKVKEGEDRRMIRLRGRRAGIDTTKREDEGREKRRRMRRRLGKRRERVRRYARRSDIQERIK